MSHRIRVTTEVALPQEAEVRALITACAEQVLLQEGIDFDAFLDVTIVDGQTIRQMNAEYRDKDTVTDVLSFPMYAFYNRACEQAVDFGHSAERECGFLTVHSVLHLLGYDHERDEADRLLMRKKEEENLTALGLVRKV